MNLEQFLENLAGSAPTPGGGAVAALNGAQGAALISMVATLSQSEKVDWNHWIESMGRARKEFVQLMDDDAKAFEKVMAAMKLPKEAPERRDQLQRALKSAVKPPLRVMELSWEILNKLEPMLPNANPNVISDAGIGIVQLAGAIESSLFNVNINLKFIKDEAFCADCRAKTDPIMDGIQSRARDLSAIVIDRI
jgi:formiminotetrahydrofolate cyclodeaminase